MRRRLFTNLIPIILIILPLLLGAEGNGCLSFNPSNAGHGSTSSNVAPTGDCEPAHQGQAERLLIAGMTVGQPAEAIALPPVRPDCLTIASCEISSDQVLQSSDVKLEATFGCGTVMRWETREIPLSQVNDSDLKKLHGLVIAEPQYDWTQCLDPAAEDFQIPYYSGELMLVLSREETSWDQNITFACEYDYVPFPTWRDGDCTSTTLTTINEASTTVEILITRPTGGRSTASVPPTEGPTFRMQPGYVSVEYSKPGYNGFYFDAFLPCQGGTVTITEVAGELRASVDQGLIVRNTNQ